MPVFLRALPLKDDSASALQDQHNLILKTTDMRNGGTHAGSCSAPVSRRESNVGNDQ
jgi:hypothetical protein